MFTLRTRREASLARLVGTRCLQCLPTTGAGTRGRLGDKTSSLAQALGRRRQGSSEYMAEDEENSEKVVLLNTENSRHAST